MVAPTEAAEPAEAGPADPPRNRRQEETFRKVLTAGMAMLRESSYADLTVRAVAARAKVAPATAYTYFSSKNHLIAEVYQALTQRSEDFATPDVLGNMCSIKTRSDEDSRGSAAQ